MVLATRMLTSHPHVGKVQKEQGVGKGGNRWAKLH